jgi:plasmid stabilization system protein ParE
MRYRFSAAAENDLYDAALYYTRKRRILGVRFVNTVIDHVSLLQANPCMGVPLTNERRRVVLRVVLKGFPYSLIYTVNDAGLEIVVLAIAHQSRHPNYWHNRIQESPAVYQLAAKKLHGQSQNPY